MLCRYTNISGILHGLPRMRTKGPSLRPHSPGRAPLLSPLRRLHSAARELQESLTPSQPVTWHCELGAQACDVPATEAETNLFPHPSVPTPVAQDPHRACRENQITGHTPWHFKNTNALYGLILVMNGIGPRNGLNRNLVLKGSSNPKTI